MIPIEILLQQEATATADARLAASYSQAKAYIVALANFKEDRAGFCAHLVISHSALRRREYNAMETVTRQAALFDGIETIEHSFMPPAGRELISEQKISVEAEQCELAF